MRDNVRLLVAENLVLDRAKQTLRRPVSFNILRGGLLTLTGANGSGKSSLLKALCGLGELTSGRIQLWGSILLVPQRQVLFSGLTLFDHLKISGLRHTEPFIEELRQFMPLPRLSRRGDTFSGGEKRLISLSMSLARAPDILVLDEPFAPLSRDNSRLLAERLGRFRADGHGLIVAEHVSLNRLESSARVDLDLENVDPLHDR